MKTIVGLVVFVASLNSFAVTPMKESDLLVCQKNVDCIVVPFSSCCGSTKKAINKQFLEIYNKTPAWQKFDDPKTCAVIGICMSDEKVKDATCEAGKCQLRYPN